MSMLMFGDQQAYQSVDAKLEQTRSTFLGPSQHSREDGKGVRTESWHQTRNMNAVSARQAAACKESTIGSKPRYRPVGR